MRRCGRKGPYGMKVMKDLMWWIAGASSVAVTAYVLGLIS
jgi:hypothetical protein